MKKNININIEKLCIAILLIITIYTLYNTNKVKKNVIIKIKDNACIKDDLYTEKNPYSISFCYKNKVEIIYGNKDFDDSKIYLKIDKVKDFYIFYDLDNNKSEYYMIKENGDLYRTDSLKIIDNNYNVEKMKNYNNIVSIKKLYINDEYKIYAIDKDGRIKQV